MPWLRAVIAVVLLLRTIFVYTEFDFIYLLAFGGPLYATIALPVLVRNIAVGHADAGKSSAVAITLAVLLVITAWLYQCVY